MGFLSREWPEPPNNFGVEEQLEAAIDLIRSGGICSDLLHQLLTGGSPLSREGCGISERAKPKANSGLTPKGVSFVPADLKEWLGRHHHRERHRPGNNPSQQPSSAIGIHADFDRELSPVGRTGPTGERFVSNNTDRLG
jgi:hypothetical protein